MDDIDKETSLCIITGIQFQLVNLFFDDCIE